MDLRIVEFKSKRKNILRGIYHVPVNNSRKNKVLIIFPNGGLMGCEGDYRSYVNISRMLCDDGFHIFRFSPSGLGNSDGYLVDCKRSELALKIETGLLVNDIESAVNYAKKEFSPDYIILSGICGGAISVFLSAHKLHSVKYLIPISLPVILDDQPDLVTHSLRMQKEEAVDFFKASINKIFSVESLLRLFTFKSDINRIKNAFLRILPWTNIKNYYEGDNAKFQINKKYLESAKIIFNSDRKVLFVFGMLDRVWMEFKNYYLNQFISHNNKLPFDVSSIQNSNHMFTMYEMQVELARVITNWLNTFPELS